jgi:hypothetical protein
VRVNTHLLERAMQARLDRADRETERGRDLRDRHAEEVMQNDDRTPLFIEPPHDGIDEDAVGDGVGWIRRRGREEWKDLDLDRAPSTAASKVETGVDGQAMEPGVEPFGLAEAPKVSPSSYEGILDRVARELRVPEDEASRSVQPRDGPTDEHGEGVMIALPRSLDESSLVHGSLACLARPTWSCSQPMASP